MITKYELDNCYDEFESLLVHEFTSCLKFNVINNNANLRVNVSSEWNKKSRKTTYDCMSDVWSADIWFANRKIELSI